MPVRVFGSRSPCPLAIGGCLSLHWQAWSDRGAEPWVMEVLWWGYRIPFRSAPTLSLDPIPFPTYSPSSIRGKALDREVVSLVEKRAVELAPLPSPDFYSQFFIVMKASGSWRPVIDPSTLNLRVLKSPFKMETLQSVLLSVRSRDWMVSLDLKDAYLQVPIHSDSRKCLRFVAFEQVYHFKALCCGLSTAPQVFARVMAPVSTFLHHAGIRIRRYLDDWLIQAPSRPLVLQALDTELQLRQYLGIVVNWEKSNLVPSQCVVYLGVILDSFSSRASPSHTRVEKLLSIGEEFLSSVTQPVSSWRVLLGVLSSLAPLTPGGHLCMRSLQLLLHRSWDQVDDSTLVQWDVSCRRDGVVAGSVSHGVRYPQTSTFGQTRPTWIGEPTWLTRSLWASGLRRRRTSLSVSGSSWRWREVCFSFVICFPDPRWPSSWTT